MAEKLPFDPPYTSLPDKFLFWPGIGPRLPILALICKRFMRAKKEGAESVRISHEALKKKLGGSNSKLTDAIAWLEAEGIIAVRRTKNRVNAYSVNWDAIHDPSRVRKMRGSLRKSVPAEYGKCEVVPRKIRIPSTENRIPDYGKCATTNKLWNKEDLNNSLSNNASGAKAPPGETATTERENKEGQTFHPTELKTTSEAKETFQGPNKVAAGLPAPSPTVDVAGAAGRGAAPQAACPSGDGTPLSQIVDLQIGNETKRAEVIPDEPDKRTVLDPEAQLDQDLKTAMVIIENHLSRLPVCVPDGLESDIRKKLVAGASLQEIAQKSDAFVTRQMTLETRTLCTLGYAQKVLLPTIMTKPSFAAKHGKDQKLQDELDALCRTTDQALCLDLGDEYEVRCLFEKANKAGGLSLLYETLEAKLPRDRFDDNFDQLFVDQTAELIERFQDRYFEQHNGMDILWPSLLASLCEYVERYKIRPPVWGPKFLEASRLWLTSKVEKAIRTCSRPDRGIESALRLLLRIDPDAVRDDIGARIEWQKRNRAAVKEKGQQLCDKGNQNQERLKAMLPNGTSFNQYKWDCIRLKNLECETDSSRRFLETLEETEMLKEEIKAIQDELAGRERMTELLPPPIPKYLEKLLPAQDAPCQQNMIESKADKEAECT